MSGKCKDFSINALIKYQFEDSNTFDLVSFLKRKGKTVFLFDGFNIDSFAEAVNLFIRNELKQTSDIRELEKDVFQITFSPQKNIISKLKLSEKYSLFFYKEKKVLKFKVISSDFVEKEKKKSKLNLTSVLNNSYETEISEFIYDYISSEYFKHKDAEKPDYENGFINKISLNEYVLINELIENEKLLCKLNFDNAQESVGSGKMKNLKIGFIVVSENKIFIILLNDNDDLLDCSEISEPITVKKNILKNSVKAGNYVIYPKRSNSKFFFYSDKIQKTKGKDRVRQIAELNSNEKYYAGAENLYRFLIDRDNNPKDRFLLFLNKYKNSDSIFEDFISSNDITKILNDVLALDSYEAVLKETFTGKKLSFNEKTLLMHLFSVSATTKDEQQKILPFYEDLRKTFFKKNKDLINRTVFEIKYAQFLIRSGYKRKARKILKELLKQLPDETISDLLPPDNLDLTSNRSGQLLRITVSDLLAKATDKENAQDEIKKTALLQPLNDERISKLTTVKDRELKKRAEEARNILNGNGLFLDDDPICRTDYRPVSNTLLEEHLQYPSAKKNKGLYNLQKWISEIKTDDYSSVRKYSEKIEPERYKTLYAVLKNVGEVFGFKDIEFYITKGERNDEIIGYEGTPPFVIIGYEYLNKNSDIYMNLSELQFTAASEISHIFFKHTKLTGKDVWRGLIEKGTLVADTALAVIPVAGFLAKTLKNVPKLNLLTRIFQGTANGIIGSKSAYDAAVKLTEYYGKKGKTKKEKQQSLLAASRLMQYTADRAGLFVCGNLASAVRAVLLTEKFETNPLEEIKNTSLKEFLLKQNSDGTFKYQKTALRIANLFSFYFSDDYELLRDKL